MKGLILSCACLMGIVTVSSTGLRLRKWQREYRWLLSVLAFFLPVYAMLYSITPRNLGFLGQAWMDSSGPIDFLNGLVILILCFHGFWVYVYASNVGPSGQSLVQLFSQGDGGLTRDEAIRFYERLGSVDAIMSRRLRKLCENGHIESIEGGYRVLPPARKYAIIVKILRRLFNIPD